MTLNVIDLLVLFAVILLSDLVSISIVLMLVRFQGTGVRLLVESLDRLVGKHGDRIKANEEKIEKLEGWRWTVEHPEPQEPGHAHR